MNIEEQITLYPELTREERAGVEAYVAAHPEWTSALEEAKRWDRLLADVRRLGQTPSGDEALAYYVVTRSLDRDRAPSPVADLLRRIEERIEADPSLAGRVAEMESRLHAAEEGSPASLQFDRLIRERRSEPRPAGARDDARTTPPSPYSDRLGSTRAGEETSEGQRRAGSPAAEPKRSRSFPMRIVAGLVVLAALYGILYVAGEFNRPPHERIAPFSDRELTLAGYESVRGDGLEDEASPPTDVYLEALAQLREARTSLIGLFPSYDETHLDSAAALLGDVIRTEPGDSFLSSEAAFMLGKTELARGNIQEAEEAFSRVIAAGGRRAPEARRIVGEIQPSGREERERAQPPA